MNIRQLAGGFTVIADNLKWEVPTTIQINNDMTKSRLEFIALFDALTKKILFCPICLLKIFLENVIHCTKKVSYCGLRMRRETFLAQVLF